RVVAVQLDAAEAPTSHRTFDHLENPTCISGSMNEGESNQPVWVAGYNASDLRIGLRVVTVEWREHDCLVDTRCPRPTQIGLNGGVCVPRCGHQVTLAGVT